MSPHSAHTDMSERIEPFVTYLRLERRRGALTVARYRSIIEAFVACLASDDTTAALLPAELTRQHCLAFLRSSGGTATEEPSASVWNQRRAALRSFFRYLIREEDIVKDPTADIDHQPTDPKEPEPISLDQFTALVTAAERSSPAYRARNVAIVTTLYFTALRVQEVVSLDVDHIDWTEYYFRNVRRKGKKRLHLKFTDAVAATLEELLAARGAAPADSPIFLSKRGTRISVRGVEMLVKSLAKKAGIQQDVTPHLLRHSIVSELRRRGVRMEVAQRLCGHASVRTTEKYSHARDEEVHQAVENVGAAFAKRMRSRRRLAVAA